MKQQILIFEAIAVYKVCEALEKIGIEAQLDESNPVSVIGISNGYIQWYKCGSLDTHAPTIANWGRHADIITYKDFMDNPHIIEGTFKKATIDYVLMCGNSKFEKPIGTHRVKPHKLIVQKEKNVHGHPQGYKHDGQIWDVIEGKNCLGEITIWLGHWNDGIKDAN